jgi:tyrosine-protein kinase Etk/Wzc
MAKLEPAPEPNEAAETSAARTFGSTSEDGLDVNQLWGTLRQNARAICGIGLLFAIAVGVVTLAARMEFKSSGRLYLGELEGRMRAPTNRPTDLDFAPGDSGDLSSEIQILQSASLLERAILASGANVNIRPANWEPPRYWRWRLGRRDLKLLDAGLREVSPTEVKLADDSRGVREFEVKFSSPTDYEVWLDDTRVGTGKLGEPAKFDVLSLTLNPGTEAKPRAGAVYELKVKPMDEAMRDVGKALNVGYPKAVTQGEVVRVISLDYTDASPHLASRFLRALMDSYLEERRSWKTEDASAAESFVTNQLKGIRESLDKTEQRLADYRTNHSVVVLDNEAKAMIEQIGKYEEQRVAARLQLASLADVKRALRDPNAKLEAFLAGGTNDPTLDNLTKALSESKQDLASLEQRFSEAAPDVRQRHAEVESQLEVIRNYVGSRHARAQENLSALNQIISQFEEKLKTVPGAELGLAQLARESEVYSKMYSYLLERQQQAAIVKASTVSKNRVLDVPHVPYRESSPLLPIRAGVALFGLVLGVAVVVLRRVFATTLQTESDVQRLVGRIPIFASIPRRVLPAARNKLQPTFDVLAEDPSSPYAEAVRMLRANLYQGASQGVGKLVLFTSPSPGDGKSTSSVALAVMLAADRKSVLLVDGDIRKPSHHELLRQTLEPGLSHILTRQCDWLSAIRPVPTAYGDFYAIPAGRAAPAELLSSEVMASFLDQAKRRFDFVIVDSASFPLVSDTLVLSSYADCVVSVLRLQHTPKKLAQVHVRRVAGQAPEYGIVVNDGASQEGYGSAVRYPSTRPAGALAKGALVP